MTPDTNPDPVKALKTPAQLAKDAAKRMLAQIRAKAWLTRRKKYGPRGHSGSYSR